MTRSTMTGTPPSKQKQKIFEGNFLEKSLESARFRFESESYHFTGQTSWTVISVFCKMRTINTYLED